MLGIWLVLVCTWLVVFCFLFVFSRSFNWIWLIQLYATYSSHVAMKQRRIVAVMPNSNVYQDWLRRTPARLTGVLYIANTRQHTQLPRQSVSPGKFSGSNFLLVVSEVGSSMVLIAWQVLWQLPVEGKAVWGGWVGLCWCWCSLQWFIKQGYCARIVELQVRLKWDFQWLT